LLTRTHEIAPTIVDFLLESDDASAALTFE
jgi:hypothetical protein